MTTLIELELVGHLLVRLLLFWLLKLCNGVRHISIVQSYLLLNAVKVLIMKYEEN